MDKKSSSTLEDSRHMFDSLDAPPPYESVTKETSYFQNAHGEHDPRSLSTDSLLPSPTTSRDGRRKLLLIYIHGFMGSELSFQHFPAHIHHYVSSLVGETHIVHTKMYPRYRSKKHINFARDDFSTWLTPHEGQNTDVILLGHSMGGFLTAEVAMQVNSSFNGLRHRILGTINFDVPFLGMHPGVVKSGLASLFVPAPDIGNPTAESSQSPAASPGPTTSRSQVSLDSHLSTRSSDLPSDPNYNPAFDNDINLPVRSGWKGVWHFVNKHSNDIIGGATQLVKSHVEFGWAMADYPAMRKRYARIRALEEEDDNVRRSALEMRAVPPRVRFVNFYTASTGRPKKPKDPALAAQVHALKTNTHVDLSSFQSSSAFASATGNISTGRQAPTAFHSTSAFASATSSSSRGPQVAVHSDITNDKVALHPKQQDTDSGISGEDDFSYGESYDDDDNQHLGVNMQHVHPMPVSSASEAESDNDEDKELLSESDDMPEYMNQSSMTDSPQLKQESSNLSQSSASPQPSACLKPSQVLPPLPPLPAKPVEPITSSYTDPHMLKMVQKEHSRALKAYEKAVRNQEKAIKDRAKLDEKWERKQQKVNNKADDKLARKQQKAAEKLARSQEKAAARQAKRSAPSSDIPTSVLPQTTKYRGSETQADEVDDPPDMLPEDLPQRPKAQPANPPRDRKFCTLPATDASGNLDPTWVRVYMKDMDEVTAHCGLFFDTREAYEGFVAEVAETIQKWIAESEGERVARWMSLRDVD